MPSLGTWAGMSFASSAIVLVNAYHRSAGSLDVAVELLLASKLSVLLLVCTAYFLLFLFGKALQYVFFGRLTEVESQNIYDRLIHYVLFKLLFIGAVLDPDLLDTRDVLAWTMWFSCLGFGKIFALLCRDRYLSISRMMPDAGLLSHARVVTCLLLIMACGVRCLSFCLRLPTADWSGILLLSFECFVLLVEGSQTLIKYAADVWQALKWAGEWPAYTWFVYHTELGTDVLVQCATLAHYAHILLLHGISVLDALLLLDMRLVAVNLRARIAHYRHYRTVSQRMDSVLVDADKELLSCNVDDVCAICRDALTQGVKKLPCSHLFHGQCLRAWLEQNSSCPTCRRALFTTDANANAINGNANADLNNAPPAPAPAPAPAHAPAPAPAPAALLPPVPAVLTLRHRHPGVHAHAHSHAQHVWSFGPLGALSPSISVSGFASADASAEYDEEEGNNVTSVLAMFPQLSAAAVRADLRRTRSLLLTVERALEGRITASQT